MKNRSLIFFGMILFAVMIFAFSSCTNKNDIDTTSDYSYISQDDLTNAGSSGAENNPSSDKTNSFIVDTSWQKNYSAEYKYFDAAASKETVTIKEMKSKASFSASYPDSGNFIYYTENDGDIDCYTVIPAEKQYIHSVIENQSIDGISSTLMKLTGVSEELPKLANVLYMNDEEISGRSCKKYIQRAYTDGEVTETVYIWIDSEFGFALKCEDYNADNELKTYWEVMLLSVGTVEDKDIAIDLSAYSFTEGEAQ
ncbi:MAG: hypothetical protein J1E34_02945 [Oscillospiraceae bacterium]|nr:hypothetical protein [Oscillospiraceae bacterium]